jgi:hypothetical protein
MTGRPMKGARMVKNRLMGIGGRESQIQVVRLKLEVGVRTMCLSNSLGVYVCVCLGL